MVSPGDARTLTPGQRARDAQGVMFFLDRAKTDRAAVGTLTPWWEQVLEAVGIPVLSRALALRQAIVTIRVAKTPPQVICSQHPMPRRR
jgi:hypothetical protein